MPITAASVESNGWVLRLDCTGNPMVPATNFGAYALTPDATPKVALSLSSPGFVKSGGMAVAGSTARTLLGTRPLRLPVNPLNPTLQLLDETDLGGGLIRVRIALSEEVYTGDTGLTLAVLAGWRTGESAQSGISVTNNSALAPPVPIMRWVLPPYDVATGVFRVSLIVGTVNPVGFEPAAGVKFTATDGTTVKTVWATALGTDNSYGDNLRCYTVEIDPATATALTAGLLRVDAEVYPWVGAMRTTDTAGTRSVIGLRTAGYRTAAENPWVIGYDPSLARYSQQWVYVDPVNGTATASVAMVGTSLAAAKAVAPAARALNVSTAIQALGLQNRTLPLANGQGSATRSIDGARVVLAPGTHTGFGATAIGTGLNVVEIPVFIMGDPEDSNPRATCVLNTSTVSSNTRSPRLRFRDLTIGAGGSALNNSTTIYITTENVEIIGRPGNETTTTGPIVAAAAPAGQGSWHHARTRVWRTGFGLQAGYRGLIRACEFSRIARGITMVKNRHISKTEDGFTASNTSEGLGQITQTTDLAAFEDLVVAYNDLRNVRWGPWANAPPATGTLAGISPQTSSYRRHLILNNVVERISTTNGVSTTSDGFFGYGEGYHAVMDTIIIEGNTFAGSGYNAFYSDPVPATLADVDTQTGITRRIRHANNAADRNASKHDDFSDPSTATIRAANGQAALAGWRPACIGAWSTHFGVNMEGHVDCSRAGAIANFRRDGGSGFVGLRGNQYASAQSPGYTDDRSERGSDLGGGDYRPAAGSVLLNRITRANSDRDFAGAVRLVNGAAGAFEAAATGLALVPAPGRSGHVAAASAVAITFGIAVANGLHGHGAAAGLLTWSAALGPASAVSASEAAASAVTAAPAVLALAPGGAVHALAATAIILFPDGAFAAGGTLSVPADMRTLAILQSQNEETLDAQIRQ